MQEQHVEFSHQKTARGQLGSKLCSAFKQLVDVINLAPGAIIFQALKDPWLIMAYKMWKKIDIQCIIHNFFVPMENEHQ